MALERWEAVARRHGRQLARLPEQVLGRRSAPPDAPDADAAVAELLARLAAGGRAAFTRHDLLRAALDVLPPGSLSPAQLEALAEQLVARAVSHPALVGVTASDVVDAPAELRRRDGASVYEQPGRQRSALRSTLDQEAWLLDVAAEPTGRTLERDVIEASVTEHDLGGDQADAVRELLGSQQRMGLLVGPAGGAIPAPCAPSHPSGSTTAVRWFAGVDGLPSRSRRARRRGARPRGEHGEVAARDAPRPLAAPRRGAGARRRGLHGLHW